MMITRSLYFFDVFMRRAVTQRNAQWDGWFTTLTSTRDEETRASSAAVETNKTTLSLAFSALRRGDLLDGFPGTGAIIRALLGRRDGFLERLFELLRELVYWCHWP